ncbi:MAG: serine hydrolase [Anaerolineales bacterium]
MRRQRSFSPFTWISTFLLLSTIVLTILQVIRFSRLRANFQDGMVIAGVPVGGLNRGSAAQRLLEAYNRPVELHYGDERIHMDPSVVGFEIDLESVLAAADLERTSQSFWLSFWDYLWGRVPQPGTIPLRASYSEPRLITYLDEEIATRYNQPPTPALPIPGTVNFEAGSLGTALDIERSIPPIETALRSISQRVASLSLERTLPPHPTFLNLEILLQQTIDLAGFDGIVGFYLLDLETAQEIHFAYRQGQELSVHPDVAFTTASIIKIPVMVSVFRRIDENLDQETINLMEKMIIESGNESADWLMERIIDPYRAPLEISEDLQELGLENTFLAGHFYIGAPLLTSFETPANSREDVNTDPDLYNQTTPSDMGMLLGDIYRCSQSGGGALIAVFPQEITQSECKTMIRYLTRNKMPSLLEAGIPEGTQIAHKHGWVTNNGIINLIGDAGLIFTPGGDYVLSIFLYHPEQLIWDPSSTLFAQLSRAVYNFYNLPSP